MRRVTFVLLVYFLQLSSALIGISDEVYASFPPFRYIDRFSLCVQRKGGAYCTAALDLVADGPHELLETMKNYTNSAIRHIDYTKLLYGYCITDRCKEFYKGDSDKELELAMGECLNHTLQQEYGLGARIDYATCYRHGERKHEVTTTDWAAGALFLAFPALVLLGTLYDLFVPNRDPKSFLMCFSLPSNWNRLKAPWPQDKMTARLVGINGMRAISSIMVIIVHTFTGALITIENPYVTEEAYESAGVQLLSNAHVMMQTFFFLSGMFLTYSTQISNERSPLTWSSLPKTIFLRWLRVAPLPLILLLFTMTWFKFTPYGPFWQEMVNDEVLDCHMHWRSMVFMVNNYVEGMQCNIHQWSTACDMQMYVIGLVIMALSSSPRVRNVALALAFAAGCVLAGVETYANDLHGNFLAVGKAMQTFRIFLQDPTFNHLYKRMHTNLPAYVMGMAFGLMLYSWQKSSIDTTKYKKYSVWYWLLAPLLLFVMFSNSFLFRKEGDRPDMCIRLLFAVVKNPVWAAILAVFIFGMVYEVETVPVYRRVLEWPGWVPLMRLSYCTYNVHMVLVRWLQGTSPQLTYNFGLHWFHNIMGVNGLTFLLATILWLFVEAPIINLVRKLFPEKKSILKVSSEPKKTE